MTRRRGTELESALLGAAWAVLVQFGYSGFTYEAVAARAGTSRPVLYRRWPQREDMLLAALAEFWQPISVPDTGCLRGDAIGFLRNAAAGRAREMTLMSVQLRDYLRDADMTFDQLRERLRGADQVGPMETIVNRAIERGELPDVPRSSRLVNLPFDLVRHEMLMTSRGMSDESITEIVDDLWLPLVRAPSASGARPSAIIARDYEDER